MKPANILFCVVICVKTIKCSYSTPNQDNYSRTTTSNRLTKRQADDDSDDDESSEKQTFVDPQKPGRTNNGILFTPSGRLHTGILLAPPGNSRRASHPRPFEGYMKNKNNNNNRDIGEVVDIMNKCKHYKPVDDFDFVLMADTWQIAYYISKDRLACFKISIQSTSPLKKKVWTEMYGNFNGSVKWNQCVFEMSGAETSMGADSAVPQKNYDHRHFLQGSYRDKGVFTNIIIEQHPGKNATIIEQSPDQWLVYKELLLMRDCDNGEVVVFAKMTLNQHVYTNITEIEEALKNFQEPANTGVLACNHWNNNKFRTLS